MKRQLLAVIPCLCFISCLGFTASQSEALSPSCAHDTPPSLSNGWWSESNNPRMIHFSCNKGHVLRGTPKQVCTQNGTWDPPDMPICVETVNVCRKPFLINGNIKYDGTQFVPGDKITIVCNEQYAIRMDGKEPQELTLYCSQDGHWVTINAWPVKPECSVKLCLLPPEVPNSSMECFPARQTPEEFGKFDKFMDGQEILYNCDTGYTLMDPKIHRLICKNGEWVGDLPSCVKSCTAPDKIPNGEVYYPDQDVGSLDDFRLGFVVTYRCNSGYKLLGYANLVCVDGPAWSHHAPQCILDEESGVYCPSISQISNGHCFCETKSDLDYCEPFYRGLHVECVCNEEYQLRGQSILTCGQTGKWDYSMPTCVQELEIDSKGGYSSDNQTHMSTLAIVVATACSVLGVLLLIMVIMVFRRRKPHPPRLCRPSSTPPPYSRVHSNSMDEYDRALLIENNQIVLPSYEEATSSASLHQSNYFGSRSGLVGEYRPLPSIPSGLRSVQSLNSEGSNRHSIITSSTNRDAISEVLGSIDTVNVSMSDASTAVTVDTLDSTSSHHSNMSRRATAGSISSSNNSLVTEDVPLLENNERPCDMEIESSEEDGENKTEE